MKNIVKYIAIACLSVFALPAGVSGQSSDVNKLKIKGLHIDFRAEVMTVEALKSLAEDISKKGLNTILMEWEATFPFDKHAVLCNKHSFTEEEVKDFVSYCSDLGIDVVPLQNCFGHCEYILRHDRYYDLREDNKEVSQVCPLKIEKAKSVFGEIFREVAQLHPSKYFHIGADETYLLGRCEKCSAFAAKEGKSKLFVNYIKAMSELVVDMGKIPVIWADIILQYPEALNDLPKELIFIDWNYGWDTDYFGKLDNLINSGATVWGAPSLRSHPDNLYLVQWEKHFDNLKTFVPLAVKSGYEGMIETSWSTSGVYGFMYDTGYEILDMYSMRYVYPMSGFNILIDAFGKAVNTAEPLDVKSFITRYAKDRYGLSPAEIETFSEYMFMPQNEIRRGSDTKGVPVETVLNNCLEMKSKIDKISPTVNSSEFEHYKMMSDIRINYLEFKVIESIYESDEFNRSYAPRLKERLKKTINDRELLSKRFADLNSGYLKPGQFDYLNEIWSKKMKETYESLSALCND